MRLFENTVKVLCFLFFTLPAVYAQNSPVSESANSMVDLLTGDFKFALPVMTVPGPNGEQAPITFNYSGGIRMDEQSSWLGLGWGYEPGEISHYPRGVSDDWNGKKITTITSNSAQVLWDFSGVLPILTNQVTEDSYFFGPLYFKNDRDYTKRENKMDVATSEYKLPAGAGFSFPDYDTYHVSGPGIGGSMSPKIYAWGGFHVGDQSRKDPYIHYPVYVFDLSKQVHFYFDDDINQHNIAQVLGTYWGANGTSSIPTQYDPSTNRINTGTYVEYFTNTTINAGPAGFMDYRITTGVKRPAAEFDPDGIGAFRITTPEGKVYHYSLPVYMLENEKITSFFLNNTFNLDNTEDKKEIIKRNRYAVSWKLTAVTGLDYVDANNNGIVDIGDTGYWIAYNYGKWTNDFRWKTPFFNYNPNQYNKREPSNYRYPDYQLQQYKREGTVSTGQMQVYYLNSIQTATHSALFIKEIRLDAHAEKEVTNTITPLLRLSRIVLVRNENLSLFSNTASLPYDSRFSLAKCNPSNVTPHIGNVNANETPIKAATLEAVELTGDYGICKMLHNNINNTFTTTSVIYSNNFNTEIYRQFDEGAAASTSDAANSGKLTLKEVKLFGLNYKATAPSFVFDYAQSNASKNPNFNPFRSDYWGYYKSDFNFQFRGRYTTEGTMSNPGSKNNVDAWSLKKITTPLGGEILIDYESDVYEKVSDGKGYVSPKRYFLIKSAVLPGEGWQPNAGVVSVSKDIDDFLALPGIQFKEAFLPFKTGFVGNNCTAIARAYNSAPSNILNGQALTLTPRNSTADTREVELNMMYANIGSSIGCGTYNPVYSPKSPGWGYIALRTSFASGGGVRVKQISIKDPDNNLSYINEYTYENGAAGSEPTDITALIEAHTIGKSNYANDPCMPPAVVMYGKVTVRSKSLQNTYNGKSEYRFDNMYDRSVSFRQIGPEPPDTNALIPCSTAIIETFTTVWECIGALGRPLSVTHFDNNDNIVRSELYEYYPGSPDASPSVTETFTHQLKDEEGHPYKPPCIVEDLLLNMSFKKIQCKNRLRKKTVYKDGISTTEEILAFDPSTGMPMWVRITDPTTGITETHTSFAYMQAGYADMGTKAKNPAAKNLLLAPYKVTVYRDKIMRDVYNNLVGSGNPQLIGGSKTLWRQMLPKRRFDNQANKYAVQTIASPDWKAFKTYVFNGDANDANWRETGEMTLFNRRNTLLESKSGVSNRYSAVKLGYDQQYPLCEINDARYADFAFTGFEDQELVAPGVTHFGGEVTQGQMRFAGDAGVSPHTGNFLVKVSAGAFGPGYLTAEITPGRSYRVSVWVHKNSPPTASLIVSLDGSHRSTGFKGDLFMYKNILKSDPSNITVGDWILMSMVVDVPADYVASGGQLNDFRAYLYNPGSTTDAYFDDFAVRPLDAAFTGNVMDEKTGRMLATLDRQNFATKYVYDNEGRISEIWVETATDGWKLKQGNTYKFKRSY